MPQMCFVSDLLCHYPVSLTLWYISLCSSRVVHIILVFQIVRSSCCVKKIKNDTDTETKEWTELLLICRFERNMHAHSVFREAFRSVLQERSKTEKLSGKKAENC